MDNSIQKKFKSLNDRLEGLKLEEARAESKLEELVSRRSKLSNRVKELANISSIEEAEEKLEKLNKKLRKLITEAEELLSTYDQDE